MRILHGDIIVEIDPDDIEKEDILSLEELGFFGDLDWQYFRCSRYKRGY